MDFERAKACTVLFGKYKGKSLDELADENLGYLVWLAEEAEIKSDYFKDALKTFCADPAMHEEICQHKSRHPKVAKTENKEEAPW